MAESDGASSRGGKIVGMVAHICNAQKTIELCTLNGRIVAYANHIRKKPLETTQNMTAP